MFKRLRVSAWKVCDDPLGDAASLLRGARPPTDDSASSDRRPRPDTRHAPHRSTARRAATLAIISNKDPQGFVASVDKTAGEAPAPAPVVFLVPRLPLLLLLGVFMT